MKYYNVADLVNDLLQPNKPDEYRPIMFYLANIKESIVNLTTLMLEIDKEQRERLSDVVLNLSEIYKTFSDLNTASKRQTNLPK